MAVGRTNFWRNCGGSSSALPCGACPPALRSKSPPQYAARFRTRKSGPPMPRWSPSCGRWRRSRSSIGAPYAGHWGRMAMLYFRWTIGWKRTSSFPEPGPSAIKPWTSCSEIPAPACWMSWKRPFPMLPDRWMSASWHCETIRILCKDVPKPGRRTSAFPFSSPRSASPAASGR